MRIIRILLIGLVTANLLCLKERLQSLVGSATSSMHAQLLKVEECYKLLKNTAVEKLTATCGKTRDLVKRNEIFKPRSLEEFKAILNKLVKRGRANLIKEKIDESTQKTESKDEKQKEQNEKQTEAERERKEL